KFLPAFSPAKRSCGVPRKGLIGAAVKPLLWSALINGRSIARSRARHATGIFTYSGARSSSQVLARNPGGKPKILEEIRSLAKTVLAASLRHSSASYCKRSAQHEGR